MNLQSLLLGICLLVASSVCQPMIPNYAQHDIECLSGSARQQLRCWLMMRTGLRERRGSSEYTFETSQEEEQPEELVAQDRVVPLQAKRKGKAALKALAKQLLANRKNLLNVAYPSERKLLPRLY